MDKDQRIKEEVEKTISLLDKVEEINTNPFLFTRIKAELDSKKDKSEKNSFEWVFKFLRPAIIAALLLFNVYSVISFYQSSNSNGVTREQYLESISSEYEMDSSIDYLSTNEEKD
ncbi:MAG: hypothetical protein HXY50_04295 [Ignavibacteriaceae bacterium]|nr:hypothetical protein [Ignavibacteriaceae bacterium]